MKTQKTEIIPDYGLQNDWLVCRNGVPYSRHRREIDARALSKFCANDEPDAVYTVHPIDEVF